MIPQPAWPFLSVLLVAAGVSAQGQTPSSPQKGRERPKLTLRASPTIGFPPMRSVLTAELAGGADDFEEYYCPRVEWDWADSTTSTSAADCEPYVAGQSVIRRRYTVEHTFKDGGVFDVTFRLKQGTKTVATARVQITVRESPAVPSSRPASPVRREFGRP